MGNPSHTPSEQEHDDPHAGSLVVFLLLLSLLSTCTAHLAARPTLARLDGDGRTPSDTNSSSGSTAPRQGTPEGTASVPLPPPSLTGTNTSTISPPPADPPPVTNPIPTPAPEVVPVTPVDCVLVMDMLPSMNPFLAPTLNLVSRMLASPPWHPKQGAASAWGLWGYRGIEDGEDLGFATRNFTPDLVPAAEFPSRLRQSLEPATRGREWTDGLFLGVHDALQQTRWREGSRRVLVLVGDSSSYSPDDPRNPSRLNENGLRLAANTHGVRILSVLVASENAKLDHPYARAQFRVLSENAMLSLPNDFYEVTPDASGNYFTGYTNTLRAVLELALTPDPP